jgi:hypothetical protein
VGQDGGGRRRRTSEIKKKMEKVERKRAQDEGIENYEMYKNFFDLSSLVDLFLAKGVVGKKSAQAKLNCIIRRPVDTRNRGSNFERK